MNRTQLFIALALDATPQEIEEAHTAIDNFYAKTGTTGSVTPQQIFSEGNADNETPSHEVTVDKDGLPWDERIHSSNKQLTDKGVWRKRKNVDDATFKKVTAELQATVGAAPVTTPPAVIQAPALPTTPGLPPLPGANIIDPAYTELVQVVTANMEPAGKITADWLKQVLTHYGIAEGSLQNAAHNIPASKEALAFIKQAIA